MTHPAQARGDEVRHHTNSAELAQYYSEQFAAAGVDTSRIKWVLTEATKVKK